MRVKGRWISTTIPYDMAARKQHRKGDVAKTFRKQRPPLMMNWFKVQGKLSSGVAEAMNNNVKVTIRKSYGFRQYETLKYALYHKLGLLPLPESTHEFF